MGFYIITYSRSGLHVFGIDATGIGSYDPFFRHHFCFFLTRLDELVPFVLPVLFFYSVFDTQRFAGQMVEGYIVKDQPLVKWERLGNRSTYIAYGLIGLGVLALLNNLVPWVFHYHGLADRLIPPLLILGLGIFILYRGTRKGGNDNGIQR